MLSNQNIVPTTTSDLGRGESTRSYQYSPHLLYSPNILYPAGYLYGIYPTLENQEIISNARNALETLLNRIEDILPMGDNVSIRP